MFEQEPIPPVPPPPPAEPRTDELAEVTRLLRRARRRLRGIRAVAVLLWSAAGLVALSPLILVLAESSLTWARILGGLALSGVFAALIVEHLRMGRDAGDAARTARFLAERVDSPKLKRGLLPAVELARELASGEVVAFSTALARAHIDSVGQAAREVDLKRALPDRPVRIAARALLAGSLLFLAAVVLFGGTLTRGARLLVAGREGPQRSTSTAEPITGEIDLTYVYPAHTRLPERTVPNTNGDISAPKGTQVRIKTRADREVAKASILAGDSVVPLEVQQGRDLTGTLLVGAPGSYRFRFQGSRGKTLAEGPPIPIAVEEDKRPKATLVAPMTDIEVDPKARVAVRYEAEDDFGLSEIALLYKLPGATRAERVVLRRSPDAPRRSSGEWSWDVGSLGLLAGDAVAYYLEATDNDEVSGKKTGVSKTQLLKIFSEAEHHRKTVQQFEQVWEKLVLLLGDRLESPERRPGSRTPDSILAQSGTDARALAVARELSALSATLRKEKSPEPLWQALAHAGAGLTEKASTTSDARSALAPWLRRGLSIESEPARRLARALEAEIGEEEKDVLYLEALVDRQRIEDLLALSKELAAKRRDLADVLEKYRKAPDDATRERLVREVARLKERMAELMQRMAELSKGINDEHVNAEALKEMGRTQDMMSSFDAIQRLLYQGKAEEAMKEMEKLGQALDELEKNLQGAARDHSSSEFGPMAQDLKDFARELEAEEEEQQKLLDDAQQIRSHSKKALAERLARKGLERIQKLRKKADEARQKLGAINDPKGFWREDELKRAKEDVENLDKALAVKDFDQAEQSAVKALSHAEQMADDFERQALDAQRFPGAFGGDAPSLSQNAKSARDAVPPLQEIARELESLSPPPSQTLTEADRQKLKSLAQRQGELRNRADRLHQKMGEINKQAPLFPPEAEQMLQNAQGRMGRAQGQMQARNPTGASAEARAALDDLGALKKGLQKQSGSGQGQGGNPVPWPWMSPGDPHDAGGESGGESSQRDEKVEIPNADQYQVPDEYRKDILDAMKQGAPEKYKDQVKRYYEEIVK